MFTAKNSAGWPLSMKCSFIEPGIVNYADVGMVLVRKEVLDKMQNSFVGRPVVNEDHREVKPGDYKDGTVDGIVNSVWYEPTDGMFHCGYQVWDAKTLQNINRGYRVSCAYKVTQWGEGGIHNNVPYEREVLAGEYTHLAIVPNPRYEGVRIYNAKGAKTMTLKWIKKLMGAGGKELENSVDIESSKSIIEVDGKDYTLDNAIAALKEQEAAKAKDLENKGPSDDHIIDVPGIGKRTVKELKEAIALKNAAERKNAEDDEDEKKKKEAKDKEDRENAAALQLKNDIAKEHESGKHETKEKENCAMCNSKNERKNREHFERIDSLANSREGDFENGIIEPFDGFAEGSRRFGSAEPAGKK